MVGGKSLLFSILVAMTSCIDGQTLIVAGRNHDKVVVCYVASWAAYRPAPGTFTLDDLDPELCTHLIYSFAGLDEATSTIKSLDPWQDLDKDYGKNGYNRMVALKKDHPHLKVSIAIGGWNEGSLKYSMMAEDETKRAEFIKSVLLFLEKYKFDGLDLDWEYPTKREGRPIDKANFVTLVKELKEAFEPKGYILTAALGAGKSTMESAYELTKLSRYLDFLHLMCYDYHGTWDGVVGANAPLKGEHEDDVLSVEYTIKYMLSHGVSSYKMILGLAMYGRNFIMSDLNTTDIIFGQTKVKSAGFKGKITGEAGFMGYNEICLELMNNTSNWTEHWHEISATPYLRSGNRVISYDNTRSIARKIKLAIDYNLGGLMVWSIDTDDFSGICGFDQEGYTEFTDRYVKIRLDPLFKLAVENVYPHGHNKSPEKRIPYIIEGGSPKMRLWKRHDHTFNLMRSINEITSLAIEEKKVFDEMDRLAKENEIKDTTGQEKPNSAGETQINLSLILGATLVLFWN